MKKIVAVDSLRHRLVILDSFDKEKIQAQDMILIRKDRDVLVARFIGEVKIEDSKKCEKDWTIEKKLSVSEIENFNHIQEGEKDRIVRAKKMVDILKLEMRIFASRIGWKEKTVSFFFTCDGAVDFRQLLKDLAGEFNMRIHLERVGSRDKSKIIGGFGVCGREVCCSASKTFLHLIPLDAVRDQAIMIKENNKLLGVCGKLKCCFLYELPHYREKRKSLPHLRQTVETPKGKGRVIGLDILNQKVKIFLESESIEVFEVTELGEKKEKKSKTVQKKA